MEKPEKLKTEIAVLESILREKRQKLKVVEAIEEEKEELWRQHMAKAPPGDKGSNNQEDGNNCD